MDEILSVKNVVKNYKELRAVDNVSLSVGAGRIVGLLGPNGSGKTTLLKMINGLLTVDGGHITVCGKEIGAESKKLVAYLPDKNFLTPWMSVAQMMDYISDFFGDFDKNRAYEMIKNLGINPKAKIKTLSKGTKEKVSLILTMSRKARLYILDEPIAGVDPATRDYIMRTILSVYDEHSSIIISTHLIADIEQALSDVVFINNGRIVLESTVDEIRSHEGKSVDSLFREVFRC